MDEAKRELVRSWLAKAAHDLAAARLLAESRTPLGDVAIYHCQQAAEKVIKAYLAYRDQRAEKTHDVGLLLERAGRLEPAFFAWEDAADRLTPYATAYRYPGLIDQPEFEDLIEALDDAGTIVQGVLSLLPEECHPARSEGA